MTARAASHPLEPRELEALLAALDDEHRALATYEQTLRDFGDVLPFRNIRRSEARHVAALERLCRRHGVAVPANPWHGKVERYRTLTEACAAGVRAEEANDALYERLFASTRRPDLLRVYRNLASASQQRHLAAFRRCVERSQVGRTAIGPCKRVRSAADRRGR